MRVPLLAWSTLFVFLACCATTVWVVTVCLGGQLPFVIGTLLLIAVVFASLTPTHECAHGSLSRARVVNEVVGRISVFWLLGVFSAYRYIHLMHHKHTNDSTRDPDHWSGRGSRWWVLMLRWLTIDLQYYYFYFSRIRERPAWELVEVAVVAVTIYGGLTILFVTGYAAVAVWLVLVPVRLGSALNSYVFGYLPHKPFQITVHENRYRTTLVRPSPLLTVLTLYNNFHLIHHLYPGVPFHRLSRIWHAQEEFLCGQGVEVRSLLGRAREHHNAAVIRDSR
jgi:fatty acid desaturase